MADYRIDGTHLVVRGEPAIPVMGEAHYSRIPVALWPLVLGQLRSMGVTIVSSYVFWNHHHVSADCAPDFTGERNLRAFIEQVHDLGMDFSLRVGPWVHAEARHGGLPDWVAEGPWRTRSNDPAYLALVTEWFGALSEHLRGVRPAILQIENELYDAPEHLLALKELATRAGLSADLTTATAWGGAQFDREEFQPVYGGYPDTFWSSHSLGWEERCAIHYEFQGIRDDALIGADGRLSEAGQPVDDSMRPYATCELGGGMTTSYHRRPTVRPADVGALGITKIGCGSVWQGWYMLAGGQNPMLADRPLHESVSVGAPNELPWRDYDFQAPIGAAGQVRDSAHLLRAQHAMLATMGPLLATSTVRLGARSGDDAGERVRHAIRSWLTPSGDAGLVLFNHHQPHTAMPTVSDFQIALPDGGLVPPRPVTISQGDFGAWAFNLDLGAGVTLLSSDLMPLGRVSLDGLPTWIFGQTVSESACGTVDLGRGEEVFVDFPATDPVQVKTFTGPEGEVSVVVLTAEQTSRLWLVADRAMLSAAPLLISDGGVTAVCSPETAGAPIEELTISGVHQVAQCPTLVALTLDLQPQPRWTVEAVIDEPAWGNSHVWRVSLPPERRDLDRLHIRWRGNVIRVVRAGKDPRSIADVLADQFWHGDGLLELSVAHLMEVDEVDLHVTGYAPGEVLVADQPADVTISSVTLMPVWLMSLSSLPVSSDESVQVPTDSHHGRSIIAPQRNL